ncbi:MAG TPA: selenide, water dikinase SelD [Phycisphaerae bacterium]|nr:selenide, water dikinase SelD [Phycisphaerae bacterium]
MVDLEKRKRVMQRSIRLGHCICDPKKACPCDLFKEKDVCLCAGETLEAPTGPVRLTSLVEKAGCASKIDQASLKRVLAGLPDIDDPKVLVGSAAGDDAGVYALDGDVCLVQTVDVFSPSVDDPYVFGQIAAANSLSDVYAMGGRPVTALSVIGFPIREVPDAVMRDVLRGGIDKMAEAGVPVVGGHSIRDAEIKAGFAVTGVIDRNRILTNAGAQPGDVLVLTKPIGTGILAFAVQIGRAPDGAAQAIAESMSALNRTASERMPEFDAHACTDVTGFGLMGHLSEMARASGVDVEVAWDDVPLFAGVLECLAEGIVPGGIERNRESSAASADAGPGVTEAMLDTCFDPQTSGGLLIAVPPGEAEAFVARLHADGVTAATVIGSVKGEGTGRVAVTTTGRRTMPAPAEPQTAGKGIAMSIEPDEPCCAGGEPVSAGAHGSDEACCAESTPGDAACCAEGAAPAGPGGTGDAEQAFKAFMGKAGQPGALDVATKQALNIALSVLAKCEPCLAIHVKKARQMGFSEEEIDEAAWMAIAFGGSPAMMFYKEAVRKMPED